MPQKIGVILTGSFDVRDVVGAIVVLGFSTVLVLVLVLEFSSVLIMVFRPL